MEHIKNGGKLKSELNKLDIIKDIPITLFMPLGNTYVDHNDSFIMTKNDTGILSFLPINSSILYTKSKNT